MAVSLSRLRSGQAARRRLREPIGFRIALADSIHQLDGAQWEAATRGASWFFSRAYLAMLESVPPDTIEPRYALIGDRDGPVAAVVLQWARSREMRYARCGACSAA